MNSIPLSFPFSFLLPALPPPPSLPLCPSLSRPLCQLAPLRKILTPPLLSYQTTSPRTVSIATYLVSNTHTHTHAHTSGLI